MKNLIKYFVLALVVVSLSACCCSSMKSDNANNSNSTTTENQPAKIDPDNPPKPLEAYDIYEKMEKEGLNAKQVEQKLLSTESKLKKDGNIKGKPELLFEIATYKIYLGDMGYENDYAKNHSNQYMYNEVGNNYIYKGNELEEIMLDHSNSDLADDAAYLKASIPLPGECEGYVPCYVNENLYTYSPFIKNYPNSPYVYNAIKHINDSIASVRTDGYPFDEESLKDLYLGMYQYYELLRNFKNPLAAEGFFQMGLSLKFLDNKSSAKKCFKQIIDNHPDFDKYEQVKTIYNNY